MAEFFVDLYDDTGGELDRTAGIRVYAVMLHPRDENARRLFIQYGLLEAEGENPSLQQPNARLAARAAVAGGLLLQLIQMDREGFRPSLNAASLMLANIWPKDWYYNAKLGFGQYRNLGTGRHRQRHLAIWREYRMVSHLWASFLLSEPTQLPFLAHWGELVEFLHVADYLAISSSRIYLDRPRSGRRKPALERAETVRFYLPERYRPHPTWAPSIPPLTDEEIRALPQRTRCPRSRDRP